MNFLGIDTSCYTTSVSVSDEKGNILYDRRIPLKVGDSKRGLRQSEMVFQHVKNLGTLFPSGFTDIKGVASSIKPRPQEGSYMPVFCVSESYGKALSELAGAKYYALTHQHGHIAAAVIGLEGSFNGPYLGLHVSGGTTELLKICFSEDIIESIEILGGTSDLAAGQFVDRIGVMLGFSFPAGEEMSEAAINGTSIGIKTSINGLMLSFSGAETRLEREIEKGLKKEDAARTCLDNISSGIRELIRRAVEETGIQRVILFGGVMRSRVIGEDLNGIPGLLFSKPEYSSDNACGLARQAALIYKRGL